MAMEPGQSPNPQQSYNGAYQQPQPASPVYAPSQPSPFSRAWQDVKNTPNAFATYGFKGLVNCVPILNFCFYGNAGKWQQQAADGIQAPIEKKVVDGANFTSGFFYFVITFILGLVLGIVGMVPFIGTLAVLAASFFVGTFALLMYQRYLAFGSFGDAFALSDIWDKCKRNFGSLWVATFVPQLILGAIAGVIVTVILMFCGIFAGIGIASVYSASYMSVAGILGMLGAFGIGGVLCIIVCMFAGVIGTVWAMRGCGYWVLDNVPEWNSMNACIAKEQQLAAQAAAQQQYYYQAQAQQAQAPQNVYQQQQQAAATAPQVPQQQPETPAPVPVITPVATESSFDDMSVDTSVQSPIVPALIVEETDDNSTSQQ